MGVVLRIPDSRKFSLVYRFQRLWECYGVFGKYVGGVRRDYIVIEYTG